MMEVRKEVERISRDEALYRKQHEQMLEMETEMTKTAMAEQERRLEEMKRYALMDQSTAMIALCVPGK